MVNVSSTLCHSTTSIAIFIRKKLIYERSVKLWEFTKGHNEMCNSHNLSSIQDRKHSKLFSVRIVGYSPACKYIFLTNVLFTVTDLTKLYPQLYFKREKNV